MGEEMDMSDCQATTKTWGGKPLYACEACNIRTTSADGLQSRCHLRSPVIVETKVLGPSGNPMVVESRHGGGVYDLPGGERVHGREAARQAATPTSHDDF